MKKLHCFLIFFASLVLLPSLNAQEYDLEDGYYHLISDHGLALSNQGSYTNEATLYLGKKPGACTVKLRTGYLSLRL